LSRRMIAPASSMCVRPTIAPASSMCVRPIQYTSTVFAVIYFFLGGRTVDILSFYRNSGKILKFQVIRFL